MRCPHCQAEVPNNLKECGACHAPLDILQSADTAPENLWLKADNFSFPGEEEVFTSAGSLDEPAASGNPSDQPPPAAPSRTFGPQSEIKTSLVSSDPEFNRQTKIMSLPLSPAVRKMTRQAQSSGDKKGRGLDLEESEVSRGIDELIASIKLFFARMHRLDRITFQAILVTFIASFLPWVYIRGEGLIAGVQDYGLASAGGVLLVVLCIYARTQRRRLTAWMLLFQVILAAAVVAVPVYRFLFFQNMEFVFGLHLTALSGAVVLLLSLMRLTRLTS